MRNNPYRHTIVKRRSRACVAALAAVLLLVTENSQAQSRRDVDFEALPFVPRQTVCYRTASRLSIDGKLDEPAWRATAWSDPFVDIQGHVRPPFATRVKMLWDDEYFYVAADLEEPALWGTLTQRDAVIFQDNDFELFIDPDGDTHAYYELEVNALGTVWDLLLPQPYRDGGSAIDAWDIAGLQVGVDLRGTINRPGDRDEGWTVEIAMPWKVLREAAAGRRAPRAGDQWRVNFSRVQWQLDVKEGGYSKRMDPSTKKPLPEDNWVWSPQGAINMHMPERWGVVQFSDVQAGAGTTTFVEDPNERVKWALRRLYYRQRQHRTAHGRYASDLAALGADAIRVEGIDFRPTLQVTDSLYEISAPGFGGAIVRIRQDGKVWVTKPDTPSGSRPTTAPPQAQNAAPPAPLPAPSPVATLLGIVDEAGVLTPIVRFDGMRWSNRWPSPDSDLQVLTVPASLAAIPTRWTGMRVPSRWHAWSRDGRVQPIRVTKPMRAASHCVPIVGVQSDLRDGKPLTPEHTWPKRKLAVALTNADLRIEPIHAIAVGETSQSDLRRAANPIFLGYARRAIAQHDLRPSTPLQVRWTKGWRYDVAGADAQPAAARVYLLEGEVDVTGAPGFLTGHLWLRLEDGRVAAERGEVRPDDEDHKMSKFHRPFGVLAAGTRLFWIGEVHSWEYEQYELVDVASPTFRVALLASNGGC